MTTRKKAKTQEPDQQAPKEVQEELYNELMHQAPPVTVPEVKTQPTRQERAMEYINMNYPRSRIDVAGKLDAILMELIIGRMYR